MKRLRLTLAAVVVAAGLSATPPPSTQQAQVARPTQSAQEAAEPVIRVGDEEFATWQDYVNSMAFQAYGLRCGMPPQDPDAEDFQPPSDCTSSSTTISPAYEPSNGLIQIPVVVHIIENTSGQGKISDALVQSQIDILNEDFQALPGTNGANGTDAQFFFYLATVDPQGNSTTGITRSVNNTWFNDGGQYWNTLAWDTDRYMNVYTNSAGGALGYVPGLPQTNLAGNPADRIVCLWSAFGRNAPFGPPYDQGRTLTHEAGHYFGLYHTFQGGCAPVSGCYSNGDRICDTNAEQSPRFGCPNPTSCSTPDPIDNYMDYTDDLCMEKFTPEQVNRMRCSLEFYRPELARPPGACGAAQVTNRNVAPNFQAYTATPPIQGTTMTFSVDTTPYNSAVIYARSGPKSVVLPTGFNLLIDPDTPLLFRLGPIPGPDAVRNVPVPVTPSFCGMRLYTQAVLLGGTSPVGVTNAQDLVVGS